tara:strand:- start:429 stop:1442 length:1014 start_codon:yes stop_codon:yes gene_type:complete
MIGDSAALAAALQHLSSLAAIDRPALVLGERGTGKELAAQRLHFLSPRWEAPLVKVNCAAMDDNLLDSELFGYEPGAFTGANRRHPGRFERTDGGTLFLDELATMSQRLQEKLLRVIEYGEFERLGGQQTLQVDVRVLGATNADLPSLADSGQFRADLLDRLSFDVVHLPPLRQRSGDIPVLAEHFAVAMSADLGWTLFPGFTQDAMQTLEQHSWPGNVRELKNAVERSLYRWGEPSKPVGEIILDPFRSPFGIAGPVDTNASGPEIGDSGSGATVVVAQPAPVDFNARIASIEKQLLRDALAANGHNQRRTAEALGLSYDQLRGLVRKYRLSSRSR